MFVLSVINSDVGRVGTIGYRFQKLKRGFDQSGLSNVTIARSNPSAEKKVVHMGPASMLIRLIHYLRRNYFPRLNSKKVDLAVFGVFTLVALVPIVLMGFRKRHRVAYFLEPLPVVANILKWLNFKVVYDLPIAPNAYVKRILDRYPDCGLFYHKSIDRVERKMLKVSDMVVSPSSFVAKELVAIGVDSKKVRVIPFGTDIRDMPSKKNIKSGVRFVFAGAVSDRKGIGYLLKAWESGDFSEDQLHLCGRLTEKYRKIISDMKHENIFTPGFVDVREYFCACDVYVFPSLMEGSSKSVYEAMACKLPVIATQESGSIITDGVDGLIINAFSPDCIKQAMQKIKKLDLVGMGLAGSLNVKKYSWNRYAKSVEKVLHDIAR